MYDNYECPSVNRVVCDALGQILKRRDTFLNQKHISSNKLDMAKQIVLDANERVQGLNNYKQKIMGGTSQRGCSRFNTATNTNSEDLQRINIEISVAK